MTKTPRDPTPTCSVIIPARDEECHLPACLRSLRKAQELAGIALEIVVVLNRCTDATEAIALANGCITVESQAKNLSTIRNTGVRRSTGDYIVTVDADSTVSPNMFVEILRTLNAGGCVGGGVPILPDRISLGIFVTGLMLLPIVLREGISAGLFFTTREFFEAIGGFDEQVLSAEDIDFAKRLRAFGKTRNLRFRTLFQTFIMTSCRKFDRFGDWYFVRNQRLFRTLLGGKDQQAANAVWYDFPRN
jgi:glycosyltransferase involved in cell wall biosynthesis